MKILKSVIIVFIASIFVLLSGSGCVNKVITSTSDPTDQVTPIPATEPIQTEVSFPDGAPSLNQVKELRCTVYAANFPAAQMQLNVKLPDALEAVSGSLSWVGDVPKGSRVAVISVLVKAIKVGNWTIETTGYINPATHGGFGSNLDIPIYISISENSARWRNNGAYGNTGGVETVSIPSTWPAPPVYTITTTTSPALSDTNTPSSRYTVNIPTPAGGGPAVTFEISSFPTFPAQIQIYKTIKPQFTLEYAAGIASKLGLTGEVKQTNGIFSVQNGDKGLMVYAVNGAMDYMYDYPIPTIKPALPSNSDSEAIATDILNKLGLLPTGIKATYEGWGESYNGWPLTSFIGFKREINGKYFAGPGAKYGVRIGSLGVITQIFINPVKYEPQEMVALKSVTQAFEKMKADKKYTVPPEAKTVSIDSVTVAYWLETIDTPQDYIAPVYCFTGHCLDAAGKQLQEDFIGYVEAVS